MKTQSRLVGIDEFGESIKIGQSQSARAPEGKLELLLSQSELLRKQNNLTISRYP